MNDRISNYRTTGVGAARFWLAAFGAARRAASACGVLTFLLVCGGAAAQFGPSIELPGGLPTAMPQVLPGTYPPTVAPTAAGTYYVPPAWSQTLAPNLRFVILSNFNSDAALDRETGLIWTRQSFGVWPRTSGCGHVRTGGRGGWRLPKVSELQSLVDTSLPDTGLAKLPQGHPFMLSGITSFWSGELVLEDPDFQRTVDLTTGRASFQKPVTFQSPINLWNGVLCVRGAA